MPRTRWQRSKRTQRLTAVIAAAVIMGVPALSWGQDAPSPLLEKNHPVDWWFAFKLNVGAFPGCDDGKARRCLFGGETSYPKGGNGQRFVFASSENKTLSPGHDCLGDQTTDPVGATFSEVYSGTLNYILWNDQFYGDPQIADSSCNLSNNNCDKPWGHSKGLLAWDDQGQGFIMQVTTPDWPGSGSPSFERNEGNTLGCIRHNDVLFSQSFFSLKLSKDDLKVVLTALRHASVVTDPSSGQIVRNGGPADVQALVSSLGHKVKDKNVTKETLSSGVVLIAKPSALHVPPWQMVSSVLDSTPLRVASWRTDKDYGSASKFPESPDWSSSHECWDDSLTNPSGAVDIATSGSWDNQPFSLNAMGPADNGNHAKVAVSTGGDHPYSVFGDMNEQGKLEGTKAQCGNSQNGRGGLFFVVEDQKLHDSVSGLISGDSAPPASGQ